MGLYSKLARRVAEAETSEGGVYWEPGKYLVEIDIVKIHEGRNGDFFIVEAYNLESSNSDRPVGDRCSWVLNVNSDPAPGNIRGFLAAVLGVNVKEIGEDEFEDSVADDNPLNRELVRLEVAIVPTKRGGEFSKHRWIAVDDATKKKAKELRKAAGL